MKTQYIILNYLRHHANEFTLISLENKIVASKNNEFSWDLLLQLIKNNEHCTLNNDMISVEVPENHREMIFTWLTTKNCIIEYYNSFKHPKMKWDEVENNAPYWDTTTKYRIKGSNNEN